MPITAGLIADVPLAVKGIAGLAGFLTGKNHERQNVRPTYTIPGQFGQNLALAKNMSEVGLPQQQYNNAMTGIDRNQAGALRVLGNSANPGAGLASIVRSGNDATNGLNVQDANARTANQRLYMQQNQNMANQELAKQQYDKFDKYNEFAQKAAAEQGAGLQNMFGALDGASQIGMAALSNSGFGPPNRRAMLPGAMSAGIGAGNYGLNTSLPNYAYAGSLTPYS